MTHNKVDLFGVILGFTVLRGNLDITENTYTNQRSILSLLDLRLFVSFLCLMPLLCACTLDFFFHHNLILTLISRIKTSICYICTMRPRNYNDDITDIFGVIVGIVLSRNLDITENACTNLLHFIQRHK